MNFQNFTEEKVSLKINFCIAKLIAMSHSFGNRTEQLKIN